MILCLYDVLGNMKGLFDAFKQEPRTVHSTKCNAYLGYS